MVMSLEVYNVSVTGQNKFQANFFLSWDTF